MKEKNKSLNESTESTPTNLGCIFWIILFLVVMALLLFGEYDTNVDPGF